MIRSLWKNLRVRFLLMVLLAVLPALGLLIYTADEQRDTALADAREEASRLAGLAATEEGRLIEGTRQLLVVLARLPEVRNGDADACNALFADLLADFPLYANLGVIAPDGRLICSAVPASGPTDLSDRAFFQGAIERKDFAVGEFQIGRITGVATINSGYPVLDENGEVLAVVYAALNLDWLNNFAASADLPDDAVLTVIDRQGRVLVRQPEPAQSEPAEWLGQSLRGTPVVETILNRGTGVTEAPGDGGLYLYAFVPIGGGTSGDAFLSVALPKARVVAPAENAFNKNLTRLGLVVTAVLVAAWVGGDLLVRRTPEANKVLVQRLYTAFDTGGVDLLDDIVAPNFRDHDPMPGQVAGLAGLKQAVGLFRAAFPDGDLTAEEMISEGDKVVVEVRIRGTHSGEFLGISPTGQAVTAEGVETYRIAHGKIVEGWSRFGPLMPVSDETPVPDSGSEGV
jgi:predicted ester cyclase